MKRRSSVKHGVATAEMGSERSDSTNFEETSVHVEPLRIQKRQNPILRNDLYDNLKRAPTPIRRAPTPVSKDSASFGIAPKNHVEPEQISEEADITFHPNVESTRLNIQIFEDGASSTSGQSAKLSSHSPKPSTRRRSASRMNKDETLKLALITEEDRGSYIGPSSQELMPPPASTVVQKSKRNRPIDSILMPNDETQVEIKPKEKKERKVRKAPEVTQQAPLLSDKEIKQLFERFSGGQKCTPTILEALKKMTDDFMDDFNEKLDEATGGLDPEPGDFKDAMKFFNLIPENDPHDMHLFETCRQFLDAEDMWQLFPLPLQDGTINGGSTLDNDPWNKRANDFDPNADLNLEGLHIYDPDKRKKRRKKKKKD